MKIETIKVGSCFTKMGEGFQTFITLKELTIRQMGSLDPDVFNVFLVFFWIKRGTDGKVLDSSLVEVSYRDFMRQIQDGWSEYADEEMDKC